MAPTRTATNANGHDQETQLPDSARLETQVQLDDGVALDIGNRQLFLYFLILCTDTLVLDPAGAGEAFRVANSPSSDVSREAPVAVMNP
ncbi:hypothetical protein RB213_008529 [Colletotrichum asianum]